MRSVPTLLRSMDVDPAALSPLEQELVQAWRVMDDDEKCLFGATLVALVDSEGAPEDVVADILAGFEVDLAALRSDRAWWPRRDQRPIVVH